MSINFCDFCTSSSLNRVYRVPDSAVGISLLVCRNCGLVQSEATLPRSHGRLVSTSSGAVWGNIRHGKSLRFTTAVHTLKDVIPWQSIKTALDVGSNRGDFVQWLSSTHPDVQITAVEPDSTLIHPYRALSGLELHNSRLENTPLHHESFDFIYSCHTLEHADSAKSMLEKSRCLLRPGGWMYLEVPNIDVIGDPNIVEEFFIDKHTFHFNREILASCLEWLGFDIIHGRHDKDDSNIAFVAKRAYGGTEQFDPSLPERNIALIREYECRLAENRLRLSSVASKLYEFMGRQKVVLWGAGRIFDALVRYGNLHTDRISGLVDSYLSKILPEVHGVAIRKPEFLRTAQPDVVIVLARSSTSEIVKAARRFGVRHVVTFSELLVSS